MPIVTLATLRHRAVIVAMISWSLAACSGTIEDSDFSTPGTGGEAGSGQVAPGEGGRGGGGSAGPSGPGPAPLRRLTHREYDNTLFDLLGDDAKPGAGFARERRNEYGFGNDAYTQAVTAALAEDYAGAASAAAAKAITSIGKILACDPAAAGEEVCAKTFVKTFGTRAFRRPVTDPEADDLLTTYRAGYAAGGFKSGIETVLARMLQSPFFIYRLELGELADRGGKATMLRLTSWEMASRLSYFLWESMPDDVLFEAAQAGALKTPEQIEAQARRMLGMPPAKRATAHFHEQWLQLEKIDSLAKDAKTFPDWKESLRDPMKQESLILADNVVFGGAGDIRALLTADYTFMNKDLAAFLGLPEAATLTPASYKRVTLEPAGADGNKKRKGILMHAGILAAFAKTGETSPVLRGKFILEHFLCQQIPPPPADVNNAPPPPDPTLTTRERFEKIAEAPGTVCANCHRIMDPPGFALENFDAAGKWRSLENKKAIDAKGILAGTVDSDGPVEGAVQLVDKVAASGEFGKCVARQWLRYAQGRPDVAGDTANVAALGAGLAKHNYDVRELLVALTRSATFLTKPKGVTP